MRQDEVYESILEETVDMDLHDLILYYINYDYGVHGGLFPFDAQKMIKDCIKREINNCLQLKEEEYSILIYRDFIICILNKCDDTDDRLEMLIKTTQLLFERKYYNSMDMDNYVKYEYTKGMEE